MRGDAKHAGLVQFRQRANTQARRVVSTDRTMKDIAQPDPMQVQLHTNVASKESQSQHDKRLQIDVVAPDRLTAAV